MTAIANNANKPAVAVVISILLLAILIVLLMLKQQSGSTGITSNYKPHLFLGLRRLLTFRQEQFLAGVKLFLSVDLY